MQSAKLGSGALGSTACRRQNGTARPRMLACLHCRRRRSRPASPAG
uniref:CESAB n=1 Tax=Arundo donax TaxID=35708 RepID=A0A0A9G3H5_ARUDO